MADLAIISETGMFHSLCRCTFGSRVEWYGFAPIKKSSPHGPGAVHTDARPQLINHLIEFQVADAVLRRALQTVGARYDNATYTVLVKDCVSYSADICRAVGLAVPMVNMTPYGLIQILRINPHVAYK